MSVSGKDLNRCSCQSKDLELCDLGYAQISSIDVCGKEVRSAEALTIVRHCNRYLPGSSLQRQFHGMVEFESVRTFLPRIQLDGLR